VAGTVSIPTCTTPRSKREDGSYSFGRRSEEKRYRSTENGNYEGGRGGKRGLIGGNFGNPRARWTRVDSESSLIYIGLKMESEAL